MDTSPIPGFITRKQAAETCRRSERTLQRYWSRAIKQSDSKVLIQLKLRTEDGQVTDGPEVTKDLIDRLKNSGQNPTWFVHAEWVQEAYGPRSVTDDSEHENPEPADARASAAPDPSDSNPLVSALKSQITELQRDKDRLHDELSIKNEQIKEANARTRESNTLMQQLQTLLGDVQQRAFPALRAPTAIRDGEVIDADHTHRTTATHQAPAAPSPAKRGTGSSLGDPAPRKAKSAPVRKPSSPKPPSKTAQHAKYNWYETPTLKRIASRLLR